VGSGFSKENYRIGRRKMELAIEIGGLLIGIGLGVLAIWYLWNQD